MMNYKKQVKLFKKIIPIGLKSVPELIDLLGRKADIKELKPETLPSHWLPIAMFNAAHSICNDELKLDPQDMIFRVFEVIRNEKSKLYFKNCDDDEMLTVIFEEHTGYVCTDSNRLFLELEYTRGVSKEEYDNEGMQFRSLLSHLATTYCEERDMLNDILKL